eukprot:3869288-Prymnesium_polylepis.1
MPELSASRSDSKWSIRLTRGLHSAMGAQSNSTVGGDPEPKRGSENRRPIKTGGNKIAQQKKGACPPLRTPPKIGMQVLLMNTNALCTYTVTCSKVDDASVVTWAENKARS